MTVHYVELQDRKRANLAHIAKHDGYLVREEPDGTLIWEPATVITQAERLFSEQAEATLTGLEADLGSAACRRRRFALIDLWGMAVAANGEDWLILWEPDHQSDAVVVHAIALAP